MSPLDRTRVRTVQAHIAAERRGDSDAARATFHGPRHEIVATGQVHDGEAAAAFYAETARAFPDLELEDTVVHPCADAVLARTRFTATHLGSWRGRIATVPNHPGTMATALARALVPGKS